MGRSRKGGGRVSARRWREEIRGGSNYLRLPEGLKMFSAKPGTYRLDFMSFIAGKGNPRAEPGEPYFERTFFVHQAIGPNQDWHLCPAKTFKKPCPVCEHRAKLSADPNADEALIKILAPKERQLWLIKDLMNDPDGLLLWEVSYHLFGRALKDKINNSDEEDGYDFFADPIDGLTMRLALQQSDRGKWTDVGDIEFRARKRQYDSEIVEQMPCLDDLLVITPYDRLKALFLQTEEGDDKEDDDNEPEEKSRKKATPRQEHSVGEDVWFRGKKCEIVHISGDGTSFVVEDEDGQIYKAVGHEDLSKPPKSTMKKARRDDSDDDEPSRKSSKSKKDDDWDDDDEPSKKRKSKSDDSDEDGDRQSRKRKPKQDDDSDDDDEPSKKQESSKSKKDDGWDNW